MTFVRIGREKFFIRECRTGRVKYHKTCAECGLRFVSARPRAKYCSAACRQKAYRWRI